MNEEKDKINQDQELEKYRLASHWSLHFLNEINIKIEDALGIMCNEK